MERDLAKLLAITAFRSSVNISELLPLLKEKCEEQEYQEFLQAIAAVSGEIGTEILSRIYAMHPDIEKEFDDRIKTYGRAF